jgi:hypothetical protein
VSSTRGESDCKAPSRYPVFHDPVRRGMLLWGALRNRCLGAPDSSPNAIVIRSSLQNHRKAKLIRILQSAVALQPERTRADFRNLT